MLNIIYSLKLEELVTAFEKVVFDTKIWNDPFNPPLVIFSDSKLEQWIKLHTISKKKDSILMNMNTDKLEGFLFRTLAGGIPVKEDRKIWYEKLNTQLLQTLILNKLISKTDKGLPYYKELEGSDSNVISSYIENPQDKTINQNNLYSFAKGLAHIFTEYMDSRNDDFEKGIHSKWNAGSSFFEFADDENKLQFEKMEAWQRKLYISLLGDNPLTIKSEDDGYDIQYVTLAQLIEINKKENEGHLVFPELNQNIFLLGFNNMGQSYRKLLCEVAEHTEMHLFLQAADVGSDQAVNTLLQKWNKAGDSNFDLWKNNAKGNITFAGNKSDSEKNLLNEIQNQIETNTLDESRIKEILSLNDGSITVTGAPSRIKEIEAVHSSICQILKRCNSSDVTETVSYDDFIVLAPNIQEYKIPVMQIFDQSSKDDDKKDKKESKETVDKDVEFPYIPYVFSDYSGDQSAVGEATEIFISILKKNALYRTDLFSLLRNPVIKKARLYSEEDLSAWSDWVTNLQGFRNSNNRPNEWTTLRNRLLISLLTEENLKLEDKTYKPYSDMESQSNECLFKFIDAVDKLEDWRNTFANKTSLTKEDIKEIQEFFAYWFVLPSDIKEDFSGEKIVYTSIKDEIQNQKILLSTGYESINADSFFMALKENAKGSKGNSTNLYVGGITFSKLTQNRTIPAKYVYILGLNSKVFPGADSELSIDLRKKVDAQTGDAVASEKNKQTFLCQFMSVGKELHISYVNKDLKKDKELFQSSVVDDLLAYTGENKSIIKDISIDEVRNWEDLFTQRSFRNKTNFRDLMKARSTQRQNNGEKPIVLPQVASISKLKSFLNNPFIFYVSKIFDTEDNYEGENESISYEPLKLNGLVKKEISDSIILDVLKMLQETSANNPGGALNLETIIQNRVKQNIEELKLRHIISDDLFGQFEEKNLKKQILEIVNSLNNRFRFDTGNTDFQFGKTARLPLAFENGENEDIKWELTGNLCPYEFNKAENVIKVFDISYSDKIKTKNKLMAYLTAIAKIAEEGEAGTPVMAEIYIRSDKYEYDGSLTKTISLQEAQTILNEIYKNMYVNSYKKMLLINNTAGNSIKTDYKTISVFINILSSYSDWKYFAQKELFNPYVDFGYNAKTFIVDSETEKTEYEKYIEEWKGFVPGLF